MKKNIIYLIFVLLIVSISIILMCLISCGKLPAKQFHGMYADEESGLRNPERGLRLEVALDVELWDKGNLTAVTVLQ